MADDPRSSAHKAPVVQFLRFSNKQEMGRLPDGEVPMRKISLYVLFLTALCTWTSAKDQPFQVITWPDSGPSLVRFRFSKFKDIGGMGKEGPLSREQSLKIFQARQSAVRPSRCTFSTKARPGSVRDTLISPTSLPVKP
jgi:hypothetical protein